MAKQQIEVEVLAPDAPEKCSGRQDLSYRVRAEFDYFCELCSDSFSRAELVLRFRELLGDRWYVTREEVERWADQTNYPRGYRTRSNTEIIVYFLLGVFALLTLHTFMNG